MTLEEQMICGALQTLNEEAFEDVVASERPSPTGGPSTGETIDSNMHLQTQGGSVQQSQQMLTPIQETVEHERSLANSYTTGTNDRLQSHTLCPIPNMNNNKNLNNNNNQYNKNINLNSNNSNVCTIGKGNNIKLNIASNVNPMHDLSPSKQYQNISVPLTTRLSSYPSSTLGSFTSISTTDHKEPITTSSSSSSSSPLCRSCFAPPMIVIYNFINLYFITIDSIYSCSVQSARSRPTAAHYLIWCTKLCAA